MKQKGIAPIYILIGVLIIAVIGRAYYLGVRKGSDSDFDKRLSQQNPILDTLPGFKSSPQPVDKTAPDTLPADINTLNWITYTNEKYGYSVKYPEKLNTKSESEDFFIIYFADNDEWVEIEKTSTDPFNLNKEISFSLQGIGNPIETNFQNKPAVSYRPALKPWLPTPQGVPYKAIIIYLEDIKSKIQLEYFGDGRNEQLFDQILSTFKFTY